VGSDWAQCSQLEQCYHVCVQQGFLGVFTDSVNSAVDKKKLSVNSAVDKKRLFCTYDVRVGGVE